MTLSRELSAKYEIIRLLGEGGMGRVYMGRETGLSRLVAIKVLIAAQSSDPTAHGRFQEEARICASLKHKNIVRLYASGVDEGRPYLVFELVEGLDLRHLIENRGALPWEQVHGIAWGTLSGLALAHELGVVHRDIKPANILLRTQTGEPMLMDFGVAKALQSTDRPVNTLPGMVLGTMGYMAPELFTGGTLSPAADVYSLGGTLYEALTGKHPFQGRTDLEVLQRQMAQPPPAPHTVDAKIPEPVSALVMRALAKDPKERFAGADEMREALEAATGVGGQSTVALPLPAKSGSRPAPSGAKSVTPRSHGDAGTRPVAARSAPPSAPTRPAQLPSGVQRARRSSPVILAGALLGLVAAVVAYRFGTDRASGVSLVLSDRGSLEVKWTTRRPHRGAVRFGLHNAQEAAPATEHRVVLEGLEPAARGDLKLLFETGEVAATLPCELPPESALTVVPATDQAPPRILLAPGTSSGARLVLASPPALEPVTFPDGRVAFNLPGRSLTDLSGARVELDVAPDRRVLLHPGPPRSLVARLTAGLQAFDPAAVVARVVRDPLYGDNLDFDFGGKVIAGEKPFLYRHARKRQSVPLQAGAVLELINVELAKRGLLADLNVLRPLADLYFAEPRNSDAEKLALYAGLAKLTYLDLLVASQHDTGSPRFRELFRGLVALSWLLELRAAPPKPRPPEIDILDRPLAWVPRDYVGYIEFSLWVSIHSEIQRVFALPTGVQGLIQSLVKAPRSFPFPRGVDVARGGTVTLRALVAYLGAGYLWRVTIRGRQPGRDLTVLLGHPGTAEWYPAMDGKIERRETPDAPGTDPGPGGWIPWGQLIAQFDARLLPPDPASVEVEHLSLPGVKLEVMNPELQRVAFLRELTFAISPGRAR